jgi:dienelactone hydrolase
MYKDRNPELVVDGVTTKIAHDVPGLVGAMALGPSAASADYQPSNSNEPMNPEQMGMVMVHFQNAFRHYHACLKEKQAWRELMALNLTEAKAHPAVHPDFAAAIGYCFGGQCVLEMGKCVRNAKIT